MKNLAAFLFSVLVATHSMPSWLRMEFGAWFLIAVLSCDPPAAASNDQNADEDTPQAEPPKKAKNIPPPPKKDDQWADDDDYCDEKPLASA